MSKHFLHLFILLKFILTGCTETVIIPDFSMKQAAIYITQKKNLSEFIGKHQLLTLDTHDSLVFSNFPTIIKREGLFYVLTEGRCHLYNKDGKFIKSIDFSHLIEDERGSFFCHDIVTDLESDPEWWCGLYDGEYKILRINITTGEIRDTIHPDTPIRAFKYVGEGLILLSLYQQQYMVATCNMKGEIQDYCLKKKTPNSFDGDLFYRDGCNFLHQYQMSSLVALYNTNTKKMSETTLIKDDGYVHTWQRELEYIKAQGEIRGVNSCSRDYNTICHYAKQGETTAIFFNDYKSLYLSIKKKGQNYQTIKIEPYNSCTFINDLAINATNDILCKYLMTSFQGRTDSDDSILFYIIAQIKTSDPDKTEKAITIIDVLKEY